MNPNDDWRGLVGAFVDWCENRRIDPAETLRELNAQDWTPEEQVTMAPFSVSDDV
jgi:hypothetical protein